MWFDGERVNQATYQKVAPKTLMNWLRVATTSSTEDAWDHLWSGGGDSVFNQVFGITNPDDDLVHNPTYTRAFEFETPDTTAKVSLINHEPSNSFAFFFTLADRPGTDCIDKVDYTADVATWVANAARRFHERMDEWAVSSIFPTTAYGFTGIPTDDTFLGFVSASHFDVKQQYTTGACTIQISIRIRDPEDGLGEMMVLNSDVDTGYSTKRQAPAVAAPFTGPFFVIGGHPTVWNPDSDLGLETYRGVVQNLRLADVRIYTTAATSAAKSVTESFLKVLVGK